MSYRSQSQTIRFNNITTLLSNKQKTIMITNLKRIARRPSLLLRGSNKANGTSDTDSEEPNDSFETEEEFLSVGNVRLGNPKSKPYKPPPSALELYEYGTQNGHGPSVPELKPSRRASTGEVLGQFTFSAALHRSPALSEKQAERIKAIRTRRRNSATTASVNGSIDKLDEFEKPDGPTSRRHSLNYVPNSQQPKTLYTIKPESPVCSSPMKKKSSLRSSLSKSQGQDSTRSVSTLMSHGSGSGGSVFSSTGWSVASNPESPRKSPRKALRPKLSQSAHLGSSLYMPHQYESRRTISSNDSSFSTTGWSVAHDCDSVANSTLVEE